MHILRSAPILLGFSAAAALLGSPPAQAGPSAPLPACPIATTLSSLLGSGCSRGDMNFSFTAAGYASPHPADQVIITITADDADSYTVGLQTFGGSWTGSGSFAYSVAVNNLSTDLLKTVSGSQTTTLSGATLTGTTTATGTNPGTCGSGGIPVTTWSCATTPLTYPFGVVSSTITNSWNSPLGMNQMGNTVTQQPVPGPLPLLGAATMFGFSRKLRRRIQTVHG